MYIHIRPNALKQPGRQQKEITLIASSISSIESNEDGGSTIFMLNGHVYKVDDTQRMLRTALRRAARGEFTQERQD